MLHTVMAFLPLAFLIVYALKTRKMADAMVLATLLAVLLVHRQHFFTGLIDTMYTTLGNSSYQFALCSILGFGGMISLFQASGGLMGFRDLLAKAANTPPQNAAAGVAAVCDHVRGRVSECPDYHHLPAGCLR